VDPRRGALIGRADEDREDLAVERRGHRPKGMPELHVTRLGPSP
jgi:hypothetical protein